MMKVSIGVSARPRETYVKLFGDDYLEKLRDLDQPGQFATMSVLTLQNDDYEIPNVRILGPFRDYNQVEVSRTDCHQLHLTTEVRTSGDIKGTTGITLVGPVGKVKLKEGLILANRHIHMLPSDVEKYGLQDVKTVCVKVDGEKGGIMKNVYLKVLDEASLRLHLDTDDANAFDLKDNDEVEVFIERKNQ